MRGKVKLVAALILGAALCLGVAWTPARAASQADLERKIQALEQSLQALKHQLAEVRSTQDRQASRASLEGALPEWLERITFYGDTRFRYENTSYDSFQGKSKDSRSRLRVRWRFGVKSQIHDDVELGFRLATGSDDDPTSTNQTLGNYWGEITSIGLDRAYLTWRPSLVPDRALAFTLGKAKNPFATTKAMFDGDVVPEGAWLKYTFNKKGAVQPFVLGAFFYLKEHKHEPPDDLYAYAGQVGVKAHLGRFKLTAATAYYDWNGLGEPGQVPPNVHGNPVYQAGGEDRLSSFKVWDLYAKATCKFAKKAAVDFWGHYLTNTNASGPYEGKDSGWAAGAKLKYHKFSFGAWYKYIEANATPGFIADSDSGFVNRKGFVLQAGYKMWKYGEIKLSYFNMKNVDQDIPGASNDYQTFFTDLVFKF